MIKYLILILSCLFFLYAGYIVSIPILDAYFEECDGNNRENGWNVTVGGKYRDEITDCIGDRLSCRFNDTSKHSLEAVAIKIKGKFHGDRPYFDSKLNIIGIQHWNNDKLMYISTYGKLDTFVKFCYDKNYLALNINGKKDTILTEPFTEVEEEIRLIIKDSTIVLKGRFGVVKKLIINQHEKK